MEVTQVAAQAHIFAAYNKRATCGKSDIPRIRKQIFNSQSAQAYKVVTLRFYLFLKYAIKYVYF